MDGKANDAEGASLTKITYSENITTKRELIAPIHFVVVFLAATLISAIAIELFSLKSDGWPLISLLGRDEEKYKPRFAVYGKSTKDDHLVHVLSVLERFGYIRVPLENDWDLLWAHDYPFITMSQPMKNLKPHQVVNHIPGIGHITNKVDLSSTPLSFLPRAFRLPKERAQFLEYAQNHPTALFVQKHNEHRHIVIRAPNEIDLNSNDSFVQEFIQKPFLVDGYKFDIGVYVVITSIDPLRVYIYTGDVLFRYCPTKYYPFNATDIDKYIVGDNYLPTWEVPSLKKYYERFGGSMRGAFDAYVRDQLLDPTQIWPQVENIVRETILAKEKDIANLIRGYKTGKFFDLIRVDLIIDENLKVHLMEANMSPNLSSAHFKQNSLLYEQVIYSVFNLVAIGSPIKRTSSIDEVKEMVTSDKNLAINLNQCAEFNCDKSCNTEKCSLCLPCMSGTEYEILVDAHREHFHKTDMKRIFPKPILNPETFDVEAEVQNMTKRNEWITRWFYGKCQYERNWCS